MYPAKIKSVPDVFNFATKASMAPPNDRSGPDLTGKLADGEVVLPVTYAFPKASTAMADPKSLPEPPIYPAYRKLLPVSLTLATKASTPPPRVRSGPTLTGNPAVEPVT